MHIIPKLAIPESRVFVIKKLQAPYFDPTFHMHPEFQLSYVVLGEGTRIVGDNIKSFKPIDMVLTGPNLPHVWRCDDKYFEKDSKLSTTVIVIYFQDHFLGETLHQTEEMKTINNLFRKSERGLEIRGETKVIVGKMMLHLLDLEGMDSIILLLEILNVLAKSNECNFIAQNHPVSSNREAETNRMNKVYGYVMKNFRQKISLDEVSELINMTTTSFSRYFKSRVNKSFSDFLKEIRITHACKLLKEEKTNITGYPLGLII